MADEGMSGIGFNANFSETGDAKRLIADIQQLIAVVSQLGTASELTSKKFPQLLNQISRGAGGAFTPHITGLRDLYKTYPTPSPERSAAYASWQSGVAGSSADISDAAYNKYITGQNWSRFSGINLVPANIRAGAMGGLQRETNTGTWRSIAGSKLYNPQNENPLSRSAFMQQGAAYNNALGAIGNLGLTAGSIQENTSRYQLGQRSAERISKMRNDLAAWQVENENLTNNEIRSIWRKTNSQRIANEQKIAAQQQATFNQQASAQAGFSRMGFGPNQAAQMAARGQVPLTDGSMNLFGRTAVSMAVLYGLQQQFRTTINLARTLEVDVARIRGITDLPGQNSVASGVGMRNDIMRISRNTGTPLTDVANSFEEVFQAGSMPTRDAANIVNIISKMSRTSRAQGFTPTQADTSALTTILMAGRNSFNLKGPDMERFAGMLFELRKRGVIEYPEISTSFGKVAQAGSLSGFTGLNGPNGIQGLLALATGVTKGGGNPSYNETMLARLLTEISKPKTMGKLNALGIATSPTDPMSTLNALMSREIESRAAGKGSFIQQSGVFTRDLGSRGASILATQWPEVQKQIKETTGDVTSLDDAFSMMFETSSEKLERLTRQADSFRALWGEDILNAIDSVVTPLTEVVKLFESIDTKRFPMAAGLGASARIGAEGAITYGTLGLGATVAAQLLGVGAMPGFSGVNKFGPVALGSNIKAIGYGLTGNAAGMEALAQQQQLTQHISMFRKGGIGQLEAAGLNEARIAQVSAASARGGTAVAAAGGTVGAGAIGYAAIALLIYEALSAGYNAWIQAAQAKAAESIRDLEDAVQLGQMAGQAVGGMEATRRGLRSGTIGAQEYKASLIQQFNKYAASEPDLAAEMGVTGIGGELTVRGRALSLNMPTQTLESLTLGISQQMSGRRRSEAVKQAEITRKAQTTALNKDWMGVLLHPDAKQAQLDAINKQYTDAVTGANEAYRAESSAVPSQLSGEGFDSEAFNKVLDKYYAAQDQFGNTSDIRSKLSGLTVEQQGISNKADQNKMLVDLYMGLLGTGPDKDAILNNLRQTVPGGGDLLDQMNAAVGSNVGTQKQYDTMTARKNITDKLDDELKAIEGQVKTQQQLEGLTDDEAKIRTDHLKQQALIKTSLVLEATGHDALAELTDTMRSDMSDAVGNASEMNKRMAEVNFNLQNLSTASARIDAIVSEATARVQFEAQNKATYSSAVGAFAARFGRRYFGDKSELQPVADILMKTRVLGAELSSGFETAGSQVNIYQKQLKGVEAQNTYQNAIMEQEYQSLELKHQNDEVTGPDYALAKAKLDARKLQQSAGYESQKAGLTRGMASVGAPIARSLTDLMFQGQDLRAYFADHKFDPKNRADLNALLGSDLGKSQFLRNPTEFYNHLKTSYGGSYSKLLEFSPDFKAFDSSMSAVAGGGFKSWQEAIQAPMGDQRVQKVFESLFNMMGAGKNGDLMGAINEVTGRWDNINNGAMFTIETGFTDVGLELSKLAEDIATVRQTLPGAVANAAGIAQTAGVGDALGLPSIATDVSSASHDSANMLNAPLGTTAGGALTVPGKGSKVYVGSKDLVKFAKRRGWKVTDVDTPGVHVKGSLHYKDRAIDVSVWKYPNGVRTHKSKDEIAAMIAEGETAGLSMTHEYPGANSKTTAEHIHVSTAHNNAKLAQALGVSPALAQVAPAANAASDSLIQVQHAAVVAAQALASILGGKISLGAMGFMSNQYINDTAGGAISSNPYPGGRRNNKLGFWGGSTTSISASKGKFTWGRTRSFDTTATGFMPGSAGKYYYKYYGASKGGGGG